MKRRVLNDYYLVYEPNHSSAMRSKNWRGYVYEHVKVAEHTLQRALKSNEVVHHLDLNRGNNRPENLLVLENSQHTKLHNWIRYGAPGVKTSGLNGVNSGEPKSIYCLGCSCILRARQTRFCSRTCSASHEGKRKVTRPSKEDLADDIKSMSWVAIGKKYGVTCQAVRKWAKHYMLIGNPEPSTEYTQ